MESDECTVFVDPDGSARRFSRGVLLDRRPGLSGRAFHRRTQVALLIAASSGRYGVSESTAYKSGRFVLTEMLVRIDVIERQTRRAESFELRKFKPAMSVACLSC